MEDQTRDTRMRRMLRRWRSIAKCWRPKKKKTTDRYRFIVNRVPTWVQLHGLPSECLTEAAGIILGRAVGEVMEIDTRETSPLDSESLRIRLWLSPSRPLVIGFYLPYPDNSLKWIQCRYEKSYEFCTNCWCAGHKSPQCDLPLEEASRGVEYFLIDLYNRLDGLILPAEVEDYFPRECSPVEGGSTPLSVQSPENEFLEEWRNHLRAGGRREEEAESGEFWAAMMDDWSETESAEELVQQQEEILAPVLFQSKEQSSDENEIDSLWSHWETFEHDDTS